MIQYNIQTNYNNVTILAIKGTSNKRDILVDAQLYLPSFLLTILDYFSSSIRKNDEHLHSLIEYIFNIPYRTFSQFFMIEKYLEELKAAYINNKKTFFNDTIIVGHSLGGGLAKILGKIFGRKAIALSGPGINAFNSLWEYEGNITGFELTTVDIVPDSDPIPRVELSGGTIYRILCLKSPFKCHDKELSLCESLITCRNPFAREYCEKTAKLSKEDIDTIFNSTKFNDN